MLAMNTYPQAYIEACYARTTAQIAALRAIKPAAAAIEAIFCNNLVLVMEMTFAHRTRALELKDGNPCNEVRMIANSLLLHGGKMTELSPIKYKPATAVLGLKPGDTIALGIDDTERLADAFFADLSQKFGAIA